MERKGQMRCACLEEMPHLRDTPAVRNARLDPRELHNRQLLGDGGRERLPAEGDVVLRGDDVRDLERKRALSGSGSVTWRETFVC